MSVGQITGQSDRLNGFQDFSIQCFDSIDAFVEYGELIKSKGNQQLLSFLEAERNQIDEILQQSRDNEYGLIGTNKAPLSYQDALNRTEFVYKEEYERAKNVAKRLLDEALEKSSLAKAMDDKMIFTERELGEFVYQRASMSIEPNLFYYSRVYSKEIDENDVDFKVEQGKEVFSYKKDGSKIELCIKVAYPEGDSVRTEYYEASSLSDEKMTEIVDAGGIIDISSNVKKVYQFKEKQPRIKNAVKVFLATTVGGFTAKSQYGDFYTGVTAVLLTEYLQSKGYSVELVMVLGGGRCTGCLSGGYYLNTPSRYGRRYIGVTVKSFNEQLDVDKLLYWTADPSALKIKLLRYFNAFHWLYGDAMTNRSMYWHGINKEDMVSPVGTWYKKNDVKKGDKDLMYFFVQAVDGEQAVAQAILNIVLTCENINYQINQKAINTV